MEGWTPGARRLEEEAPRPGGSLPRGAPGLAPETEFQVPVANPTPCSSPASVSRPNNTLSGLFCAENFEPENRPLPSPGAPATAARCPLAPQAWGLQPGQAGLSLLLVEGGLPSGQAVSLRHSYPGGAQRRGHSAELCEAMSGCGRMSRLST